MKFQSFEEFWPYYVSQHMNPVCRYLHHLGTGLALGTLAASVLFPPLALAAPVVGYGMSWIGHFVFEKNIPATFGHTWWSFLGDFKMLYLFILGRMGPELERARVMYGAEARGLHVVGARAAA